MKYQYYLASPYRNKDIVLELATKLREKSKTVYCFLESDASIKHIDTLDTDPLKAMQRFEETSDWINDVSVKEIFDNDINALKDSEQLILLLPAGKSSHMEAGIAYGLGKPTILVGEQKEAETLYLTFSRHYSSIDEFLTTV